MTLTLDPYVIRKYRREDRAQVRAICFDTGLMGESIAPIYGDRESFADMFTGYYTDAEPESAWVVTHPDDDTRLLGYFLGCIDTRKAWDPARVGMRHVLTRGLLFRPSTARFYLRLIGDVIRDGGVERPRIDFDRYPAHYHVNLLPEARGGVGLRLHVAFVAHLRARGVRGLHTETLADNEATHRIGARLGYQLHGETFPLPGMRALDGRRLRGQAMTLDLDALTMPRELKPVRTAQPLLEGTAS